MKLLNHKFLPLLIGLFLFVIPFFWMKPGEMDLGGDSSRLYFYDPVNYLNTLPLYGITPDGVGAVVTGHYLLPFTFLLFLLKQILGSSWLMITLFNSLSLVISFVSIYRILQLLLENEGKQSINSSFAGIVAGLFYIFSPILTGIGWEKALISHNQIFLNPLIFLLLLKYVHFKKISYLLLIVLISFIFSANFSLTPSLFAFFPLAILFLLIYALKIRKEKLNFKEILLSLGLFIGVNLFHLLPMLFSFFSQNSSILSSAFSDQGKFVRGLSYFLYVITTVKLSNNILSLFPGSVIFPSLNFLWIVFPTIVLISLFLNKIRSQSGLLKKMFLLTSIFFLITLFLNTANITTLGLNFYKSLFNIPGFAMFRNYWGQFSHVYIFFYTLFLGQALFYLFIFVKRKIWRNIILLFLGSLIIISSWGFIRGDVINFVLNPEEKKGFTIPIKMDSEYEKFLDLIRKDSIDGKYLALPLTDSAYQILQGENGGAYMGPSTIAYLTGKKDFSGVDDFSIYKDEFLNLVKIKDYENIKKLLATLNIKYIFYNSDPDIYIYFKNFPSKFIRTYFPTQKSYEDFISKLDLQERYHIGKYYLYSVREKNFLPHFYASNNILAFPMQSEDWSFLSSFYASIEDRVTIGMPFQVKNSDLILKTKKIDIYKRIIKDYPLPVIYPFAKWKLNSFIYPLIVYKENMNLKGYKLNIDSYVDRIIFYNSKRISELARWEGGTPVFGEIKNLKQLMSYYEEPRSVFDYFKNYNGWEISLSRYAQGLDEITNLIDESKNGLSWKYEKRSEVLESIKNNEIILNQVIEHSLKSDNEKKYLQKLLDDIFNYFSVKNSLTEYSSSVLEYSISGFGRYDIYIEKSKDVDISKSTLKIGGSDYLSSGSIDDRWVRFNNIDLNRENNLLTINIPSVTLIKDYPWEKADDVLSDATEKVDTASNTNLTSMETSIGANNQQQNLGNGFAKRITNFEEDTYYLISFDYLTYGSTFKFSLWTRGNADKINNKFPPYTAQFHETKNVNVWTKFNIVLSSKNLHDAIITTKSAKSGKSKIDIKDFSVVKLPFQPNVVAKKVELDVPSPALPKIIFEKINPVKYKVEVEGAKLPYSLIFLEAFDRGWKIYLDTKNTEENKIIASYFNGDVKQKASKNIFLDKSTFETWNKKSILENKHFVANGYANAWMIDPKDVDNKENYTLIIELQNEKIFYISLGISLLSVIACLILLLRKNNEK